MAIVLLSNDHCNCFGLGFYDKVVKAHVKAAGDDEGRTAFADQIEAEDRAAMERAQRKGCTCS